MGASTLVLLFVSAFLLDVAESKCVQTKQSWQYPEKTDAEWKAGNIYMIRGVEFMDTTNSADIELYIIGEDRKRAAKPCAVFKKGTLKPGSDGWITANCDKETKGRAGYIRTSKEGLRVCGPDGKVWLAGELWCPPGQVVENGVCKKVDCPAGHTMNGSKCEPIKCPTGQVLKGSKCEPIKCPTGQVLKGNKCEPIKCPAGQVLKGNKCEPIPCPADRVRQGSSCVCKQGMEERHGRCVRKPKCYQNTDCPGFDFGLSNHPMDANRCRQECERRGRCRGYLSYYRVGALRCWLKYHACHSRQRTRLNGATWCEKP